MMEIIKQVTTMTNREKYKEKRDAYDMMMTIWKTGACPIRVIGGESCLPRYLVCKAFDEDCPACIQKWLNEEAEK